MRVLVIEDCDHAFRLVEYALANQFVLSRASTLTAGLEMAVRERFDLVILDLTLNDSTGYATFEKAHATLSHTPILVLSGIDDEELELRAVSNGAQDYVRKSRLMDYPFDRAVRYAIERRRVEDAARKTERQYRTLFDNLPAAAYMCDPDGLITYYNEKAVELWGRAPDPNDSADRFCGSCKLFDADGSPISHGLCSMARTLRERQSFEDCEVHIELPGGERRAFIVQVNPVLDENGGLLGAISVLLDLSSQRRAERELYESERIADASRKTAERLASEQQGLRAAVAAMEQVLGVVAHELRTPLAALRAISEFLCIDGARDTAEADGFLCEISREVDRMSDTVNNLLEAARLNSGRAKWNWSQVDLLGVINEAVSSVQPLISARRIRIENRVDRSIGHALGDADAIRRLLINLLSNALKHTVEGRIEISGRRYTQTGHSWIELIVNDSGCGIGPEVLARLGEAFALNSGVVGSNHVNGTGLGLAICKGIVTAHAGRLLVESVPGQGTTVTVQLCADLAAPSHEETDGAALCEGITE